MSICDQLSFVGIRKTSHEQVRADICQHIEANAVFFEPYITGDEKDEGRMIDAKNVKEYVTAMSKDGAWGGSLELIAASQLYKVVIQILYENNRILEPIYDRRFERPRNTLHLVYLGNSHYVSFRPL